MAQRKIFILLTTVLVAIDLVGCSLPLSTTPTPFVFPTPNQTMTAIFKPPVSIPPTVTLPAFITATQSAAKSGETQAPDLATPTAIFPSATPSPAMTATNTPAPAGTGAKVTAKFISTAPTINGPWDDWTTAQLPMQSVVFGAPNWTGKTDLSGAYRIGWDNTYLYLAVKVTDDKYVQNETGSNIYLGDSLELLLDTDTTSDAATTTLSADDYQLGISPGKSSVGTSPEAYLWYPASKVGSKTEVKIGAVSMQDGYRVEAAVPWTLFGITPASGQQFGFALSISDNDNTDKGAQQSMVSNLNKRNLNDPSTWGVLALSK